MAWTSIDQAVSPLSGISLVDSLIATDHPTYNFELPLKTSITYTFTISSNVAAPTSLVLKTMTESQQSDVRQALGYISSVTGISFTEAAGKTTDGLVFAYYSASPRNAGIDYYQSTDLPDATGALRTLTLNDTILLNSENPEQVDPSPGTDGYATILHEVGHALGLKHPFEDSPTLPTEIDNESWTVMSYTSAPSGVHPTTYGPVDLAALDWLYGGDGLRGQYGLTVNAQNTPVASPSPLFALETYSLVTLVAAALAPSTPTAGASAAVAGAAPDLTLGFPDFETTAWAAMTSPLAGQSAQTPGVATAGLGVQSAGSVASDLSVKPETWTLAQV